MLSAQPAEAVQATKESAAAIARPEGVPEKFWDSATGKVRQDELLKSYAELEKLRGKPTEEAKPEDKPAEATKVALERKPEDTPAGDASEVSAALAKVGIDFEAVNAEYQEAGAVKPETRAKLEAAFGKAMVDNYFEGLKALEASAVLSAHDAAGGKEVFDKASAWAAAALNDADFNSYNALVANPTTQKQGVEWLVGKYKAANPSEGSFIAAESSASQGDVYASSAEMTAAMRDPRYARDPAYRQQVAEKLQRSKKAGTVSTGVTSHTQSLS